MSQALLGMLGLGGGGILAKQAYDTLGETGDTGLAEGNRIGQEGADMANFTGYGVTGPLGGTTVAADGTTDFNLNPSQQAFQDWSQKASLGFMQNSMGTDPAREQEIYDRIRAMQSPEEQRQQLALENRTVAQGRQGLTTAAYGGTPEQLAMQKAIQEAQNSAAYQSIDLARQQQAQDASLAQGYGNMQYLPSQGLFAQSQAGSTGAQLADIGRRQGANLFSEGAMSGLDAQLAARLGQANLMGNLGSAAISGGAGMLSSVAQNGGSILDDIWSTFGG